MKLPKIKSIHSVLFLKDKIRIGMGTDYSIEIENPDEKYTKLIKSLDGRNNIEEITEKCVTLSKGEILESIDTLYDLGYIEDNSIKPELDFSDAELQRYSVNLNFFSTLDTDVISKYEYQRQLIKTHVLILGIGGIGSNICLSLAELGIGKITAVDFDVVEYSNLNRQVLYNTEQLGRRKTDAAKDFMNKFNPEIEFDTIHMEISSSDDIEKLIFESNCDIVVNVADYPTGYIDFWVNEACVRSNTPCFSALVGKKNGRIYSIVPNKSACFYCQYLDDLKIRPDYEEELETVRNIRNKDELDLFRTPNGALGPACLFHGYFIAYEIMRYIFWGTDKLLTYNKRFSIDFMSFQQEFTELNKYSECPVCSER
ncbi:ThiF family adenylyltransferase [Streptococcus suis]|uniref:HesA/MoeB/ThiF family protein n=1 Tax=Streptococcus suis TaxID=1307 RepID=UPI000F632F32|nr:ThiF family adenylyltransferase [Streptococcus suis]RRR54944.1 ThiF family adenylyltransferase [Streptococcus suis]